MMDIEVARTSADIDRWTSVFFLFMISDKSASTNDRMAHKSGEGTLSTPSVLAQSCSWESIYLTQMITMLFQHRFCVVLQLASSVCALLRSMKSCLGTALDTVCSAHPTGVGRFVHMVAFGPFARAVASLEAVVGRRHEWQIKLGAYLTGTKPNQVIIEVFGPIVHSARRLG